MFDVGFIIGEVVAFYLIYLPLALIFKHKVGLIVTTALCVTAEILAFIYMQRSLMLIGTCVGALVVMLCKPIQIRNGDKTDKEDKDDK